MSAAPSPTWSASPPTAAQTLAKAASTPADQSVGVVEGLRNLAAALAPRPLADLLRQTERIVHGTTVATNALLERKGAKVGLLTTEGHRDVIEMREGLKPERYDLRLPPPEPLVPRAPPARREGAAAAGWQRGGAAGCRLARRRHRPAAARRGRGRRHRLPACLGGAAARARRRRRGRRRPARHLPSPARPMCCRRSRSSSAFSTTAVNAYVGPVVSRYLGAAGRAAGGGGLPPARSLSSSVAWRRRAGRGSGAARGRHRAVRPGRRRRRGGRAGGAGARPGPRHLRHGRHLTDIALVAGGEAALGRGRTVGGERIALESLDIVTLGAGGGSIAHLGAGGTLQVGPRSAGAVPGPGLLRPGRHRADGDRRQPGARLPRCRRTSSAAPGGWTWRRRRRRSAGLAARLGITPGACAAGIHALVNARMADGVRLATVRRGVDPRDCALLAFGGAAGLHATAVARELGLAPRRRAAVCRRALRLGHAAHRPALRADPQRGDAGGMPADAALRALFDGLEAGGPRPHGRLARRRDRRPAQRRHALWRAGLRDRACRWTASTGPAPTSAGQLRAAFHARHRGAVHLRPAGGGGGAGQCPASPWSAVLPRQAAAGLGTGAAAAGAGRRSGGSCWTAARSRRRSSRFDALAPDQAVAGPAIIESATTTVLLRPGDAARMDARGWLEMAVPPGSNRPAGGCRTRADQSGQPSPPLLRRARSAA